MDLKIVNLMMWVFASLLFSSLFVIIFVFSKAYNSYKQRVINSANGVIDTNTIDKIIKYYKKIFNLDKYEVQYIELESKNFTKIKKIKNRIQINKLIFASVGYEIDYLISNLWMIWKTNEKNGLVSTYRLLNGLVMNSLIIIFVLLYFICSSIFIYSYANSEELAIGTFTYYLWYNPIQIYVCFSFFFLILLNYYICIKLKAKVENLFNTEVAHTFKAICPEYLEDFKIARFYSTQNKLPFVPLIKKSIIEHKWLGSFTRY